MAERHEQLPELSTDAERRSARSADDPPNLDAFDDYTGSEQAPKPTENVSQWKLLKLIQSANGLALGDICWHFQLDDRQSPLIQFGIGQLLRARRIRAIIGPSRRNHQVGTFYEFTGVAAKPEGDEA